MLVLVSWRPCSRGTRGYFFCAMDSIRGRFLDDGSKVRKKLKGVFRWCGLCLRSSRSWSHAVLELWYRGHNSRLIWFDLCQKKGMSQMPRFLNLAFFLNQLCRGSLGPFLWPLLEISWRWSGSLATSSWLRFTSRCAQAIIIYVNDTMASSYNFLKNWTVLFFCRFAASKFLPNNDTLPETGCKMDPHLRDIFLINFSDISRNYQLMSFEYIKA